MEQQCTPHQQQQASDAENRFIQFYANMASANETAKDFLELSSQQQMPTTLSESAGAGHQAGGSSSMTGLTVVAPTQATVQQAKKQVVRRAPTKVRKTSTAKKIAARRAQKKKTVKKRQTKSRSKNAIKRKRKPTGSAAAKSKAQKRRAQKGAGHRKVGVNRKRVSTNYKKKG